jgi:hypothetical protein
VNLSVVDCECGQVFQAELSTRHSPADPSVWMVGLVCPYCHAFYLSYHEDESIVQLRKALVQTGSQSNESKQKRRLHATTLDNFSRQFDALQKRMTGGD